MRIAVLSTGPKLYSTKRLLEAIRKRGHEALLVNHLECQVLIEEGKPTILYKNKPLEQIDAVIPRIGASATDYGCAVVRQFEMMKVFTAVKSQAILRSRNKLRSLQVLSKAGVQIPKTVFSNQTKYLEKLIKQVGGLPVILKFLEGTQGVGVVLAETTASAKSTLEAFHGLKTNVLLQEYIAEANGADVRAFVINNRVVAAMKRQGRADDFRSNLHRGGSATPIVLTPEEEKAAILAAKALGVKVAGVDLIQSKRGPMIMEVNSSPGLRGIEQATGINIADLIVAYIEEKIPLDEGDLIGV
ncbi:MAG: 30S ribosomal protein S6--L-glutamate ligase [Cytophagia bacterium]|nr:MAG: 30S ribosomal protein S6--L-glutamate ligase [Runella sp.]TAG19741.1 MAG: 30S ribosomal protein S6--L-glutamate ligase [Cytophagales bacterium]TAG38893.1 MAG: 30S ribosomal protein S6--L-glutamate ligase [Cytophagia bacterium]TAG48015.1 MAG: 30S ribosomal protein S6--L-glutamate ligase [Runella slithyformis]TAG70419.1 MAG: 30S ribosomal protein S6--L-glutamate ligase [Runella slithyformis]